MKRATHAALSASTLALATLGWIGLAAAQGAPAPVAPAPQPGVAAPPTPSAPPPPPRPGPRSGGPDRAAEGPRMGPPPGGPDMRPPPPPPMERAATFRLRRGDYDLRINCAEDEPTRACVDAAMTLLERFNAATTPR